MQKFELKDDHTGEVLATLRTTSHVLENMELKEQIKKQDKPPRKRKKHKLVYRTSEDIRLKGTGGA